MEMISNRSQIGRLLDRLSSGERNEERLRLLGTRTYRLERIVGWGPRLG